MNPLSAAAGLRHMNAAMLWGYTNRNAL